jgi:small-conductance mechanosensitive channel/CRP-like cAMP-binding protein
MKNVFALLLSVVAYLLFRVALMALARVTHADRVDAVPGLRSLRRGLHVLIIVLSLRLGLGFQGSDTVLIGFAIRIVFGWICLQLLEGLLFDWYLPRVVGIRVPGIARGLSTAIVLFAAVLVFLHFEADIGIGALLITAAVTLGLTALIFRGFLQNLFQGLSIFLQRNLRVGDHLQIEGYEGEVVALDWQTTSLRREDGGIMVIPNRMLIASPVINYGGPAGHCRTNVEVAIAPEAPPNLVIDALLATARDVPGVLSAPRPEALYRGRTGELDLFRIFAWVGDRKDCERVRAEIAAAVWYRLRREGIVPTAGRAALSSEELVEWLTNIPLFAVAKPCQLQKLAQHARMAEYGRGEFLCHQGELGDCLFVLKKGLLEVRADATGGPRKINTISAGGFVGERSLLTGETRNAHVVAIEDCQTIVIAKQALGELLSDDPSLADKISAEMLQRERQLRDLVDTGLEADAEARTLAGRIRRFFGLSSASAGGTR